MQKFKRRFFKLGENHHQVLLAPNMFLEVKIHKDRTHDLYLTNPKFTKPKLGKELKISEAVKEKSNIVVKQSYLTNFFKEIEETAIELSKLNLKKKKR